MLKYSFMLLALISSTAFSQVTQTGTITDTTTYIIHKPVAAQSLIDPGKSIGYIKLNSDAADAVKLLGNPDKREQAGAIKTWYANHDMGGEAYTIYSRRDTHSNGQAISKVGAIRITSPLYKTADSVMVGSSLADIKKRYRVKPTNAMATSGQNKVYDDLNNGIAFEVDNLNRCTAIIVHMPFEKPASYFNL